MAFLPEFRRASTTIGGQVVFGAVDCTAAGSACSQQGVRAYPTTIFYNSSKPHRQAANSPRAAAR